MPSLFDEYLNAIKSGNLTLIEELIKNRPAPTDFSVLLNQALLEPHSVNGDAIVAKLIKAYKAIPGDIIVKNSGTKDLKYNVADWCKLNNMPLAFAALKEKANSIAVTTERDKAEEISGLSGASLRKEKPVTPEKLKEQIENAEKIYELYSVISFFDVAGIAAQKVYLPDNFGYGLYQQAFSDYLDYKRDNETISDDNKKKFNKISEILATPKPPSELFDAPKEGERIILDLGYNGHVFNAVLENKDGNLFIHYYDRGAQILGPAGTRHLTKKIKAEDFQESMQALAEMRSMSKDDAQKHLASLNSKFEPEESLFKNLTMKGYKGDYCASLGRKDNVRALLVLEFGEVEGQKLYKEFSRSTKIMRADAISKSLGSGDDATKKARFQAVYESYPTFSAHSQQLDSNDIASVYDKTQSVLAKRKKDFGTRENVKLQDVASNMITRFLKFFLKTKDEREAGTLKENEIRTNEINQLNDVRVKTIRGFDKEDLLTQLGSSLAEANKTPDKRDVAASLEKIQQETKSNYGQEHASKTKILRFINNIDSLSDLSKVNLGNYTVLKHICENFREEDQIVIKISGSDELKVSADKMDALLAIFERELYDRAFAKAEQLLNKTSITNIESVNYEYLKLDELKKIPEKDQGKRDDFIQKKIIDKFDFDEVNIESPPTLTLSEVSQGLAKEIASVTNRVNLLTSSSPDPSLAI